jgi:hypothetical protein
MVFPIHSFLSPTSPFPTRWLPRLVRHFSRGTMRMLRLPAAPPVALRFSSNNGYLLASISFRSPRAPGVAPAAPGRWSTGFAYHSGSFHGGSQSDLSSSQGTLSCFCPALRPRSDLHAKPVAALRFCPRFQDDEGSSVYHYFEAPSHGFRTAPYASCRHR